TRIRHRQGRQFGNGAPAPAEGARYGIKAIAVTAAARFRGAFIPGIPRGLFTRLLGIKAGKLKSGSKTGGAPAMLGVVREDAWIRLGKTGAAAGPGAFDREMGLRGHIP